MPSAAAAPQHAGERHEVAKYASRGDLRAGSRALHDERLLVVAVGHKLDDVVAAGQLGKRVRPRIRLRRFQRAQGSD